MIREGKRPSLETQLLDIIKEDPLLAIQQRFGKSHRSLFSTLCKLQVNNMDLLETVFRLDQGALLDNTSDNNGAMILHEAVQSGAPTRLIEFLIRKHPQARNVMDDAGKVPLCYAVLRIDPTIAKLCATEESKRLFPQSFQGLISSDTIQLLQKVKCFQEIFGADHKLQLVFTQMGQQQSGGADAGDPSCSMEMARLSLVEDPTEQQKYITYAIGSSQQNFEEKLPLVLQTLTGTYDFNLRIEQFQLKSCSSTTANMLKKCSAALMGITELHLDQVDINDEDFEYLMKHCISLKTLHLTSLRSSSSFSGRAIRHVTASTLFVGNCPELVTSKAFKDFLTETKHVKHVRIFDPSGEIPLDRVDQLMVVEDDGGGIQSFDYCLQKCDLPPQCKSAWCGVSPMNQSTNKSGGAGFCSFTSTTG